MKKQTKRAQIIDILNKEPNPFDPSWIAHLTDSSIKYVLKVWRDFTRANN